MKQQHKNKHSHKWALISYFIGLGLFLITLLPLLFTKLIFPEPTILILNISALILAGFDVISEGLVETVVSSIKQKRFKPNIHILMTLGALGAIFLGEYYEATLLILIFAGAHFLEHYAKEKSKKEIHALLALKPQEARLVDSDGQSRIVPVSELKIGDFVLVLKGDQVPTDGKIYLGETFLNEAMITGESMAQVKKRGDNVYGGTINLEQPFTMEVSKDSADTVFAKILSVVKDTQENLSQKATFIKKFEPIYVTIVILLAPLFYLVGRFIFTWDHALSLNRMIIFFIAASPCALAVSDIPSSLSALSNLAKRGVIFKGGAALAEYANIKTISFDKTGTLTIGKPRLSRAIMLESMSKAEEERIIKVLVSMEKKANHPLADALVSYYGDVISEEITINEKIGEGVTYVAGTDKYVVGKPNLFNLSRKAEELVREYANEGEIVIIYAVNETNVMLFTFIDPPKEEAKEAITYFKMNKIEPVMITGDNNLTANTIAKAVGINQVYANVLPHNKKDIIVELQKGSDSVAMVGDGVNDAPALVKANVGIAMGNGTDVAIEVADAVLVNNEIHKLVYSHQIAKRLDKVVKLNIIFSLFIVFVLLITNFWLTIPMGLAVTIHEGSTVIVIIHGLTLLKYQPKVRK